MISIILLVIAGMLTGIMDTISNKYTFDKSILKGINDKTSFVKKFIDRLENEAQVNTEYLYHVFNGYTDTVLEYINKYY